MKISTILFAVVVAVVGAGNAASQTSIAKPTPTPEPQTFDDIFGLSKSDLKDLKPSPNLFADAETEFKAHQKEFDELKPQFDAAGAKVEKIEKDLIADNRKSGRGDYTKNAGSPSICSALADYDGLYDKTFAEWIAMADMIESGKIAKTSPLRDAADRAYTAMLGKGGDLKTRQMIWECGKFLYGTAAAPAQDLATRTKAAIKKKDYDAVLAELNDRISKNKKDAEAFALRGDIYLAQNQVELARADYDRAVNLSPKTANYYYKRGMSYRESPNYDIKASDSDLAKALELDPNNSGALTVKGFGLMAENKIAEAKAVFENAVRTDPSNGPALYRLGDIAVKENNAAAAIDLYTRSIAADPTNEFAYGSRAEVYTFLKQYDKAVADYDKVIEIDPKREYGWGNRASLYFKLGIYDLAVEDYTKILTFTTTPDGYTRDRGAAYEAWGKYDEALADYKTVMDRNRWDKSWPARYNKLVEVTNAARATAKEMSAVFNPALDAYTPLEKELANQLDPFVKLKTKSKTPSEDERKTLCSQIPDLKSLTNRTIIAFGPIQQLYNDGKLKGFSDQIDFAEDRMVKLSNTKKMLDRDDINYKCHPIYFVE